MFFQIKITLVNNLLICTYKFIMIIYIYIYFFFIYAHCLILFFENFIKTSFNEILSTIKPIPSGRSLTKPYLLIRKIKSSLEHLGHTK